jgi:hypothetical protein
MAASIDSNTVERSIRGLALTRKTPCSPATIVARNHRFA